VDRLGGKRQRIRTRGRVGARPKLISRNEPVSGVTRKPEKEGFMTNLTQARLSPDVAPLHQLLSMMLGVAQTQLIRVAAEIGLADLVKDGPQSIDALALATGTQAPALARVLRGLTSLGVLVETAPQHFAGTSLTALLQTDHPNSVRDYALLMGSVWIHHTWPHLPQSLHTGGSAFEALFGQPCYAYLQDHPADVAVFNAAMTAVSKQESTALQEAFDFSICHTVVDVGGGLGLLLAALLRAYPALHGILLDLPRVVEGAHTVLENEVANGRCQLIGGDFLTAVPPGGDVYILKRILMDRDDAQARSLLRHIRDAMHPNGRVLVADPDPTSQYGSLLDMLMLVVFGSGSRIRSEAELRELFASAGFGLTRTLATPPTLRLAEAVPD
jgi:hypothetical protein